MVVDDDATMRMIVRKILEAQSYDVLEASDGGEALEALLKVKPDLLLLDLNMTKVGGMEVIRGVREGLGLRDLPIVVLTAEQEDVSHELALSLGADDYVAKPFKPGVVRARINAALRRAGKLSW
jgi:DNA-binding response OmpR family regulator